MSNFSIFSAFLAATLLFSACQPLIVQESTIDFAGLADDNSVRTLSNNDSLTFMHTPGTTLIELTGLDQEGAYVVTIEAPGSFSPNARVYDNTRPDSARLDHFLTPGSNTSFHVVFLPGNDTAALTLEDNESAEVSLALQYALPAVAEPSSGENPIMLESDETESGSFAFFRSTVREYFRFEQSEADFETVYRVTANFSRNHSFLLPLSDSGGLSVSTSSSELLAIQRSAERATAFFRTDTSSPVDIRLTNRFGIEYDITVAIVAPEDIPPLSDGYEPNNGPLASGIDVVTDDVASGDENTWFESGLHSGTLDDIDWIGFVPQADRSYRIGIFLEDALHDPEIVDSTIGRAAIQVISSDGATELTNRRSIGLTKTGENSVASGNYLEWQAPAELDPGEKFFIRVTDFEYSLIEYQVYFEVVD